jgi:hypothetical protein
MSDTIEVDTRVDRYVNLWRRSDSIERAVIGYR